MAPRRYSGLVLSVVIILLALEYSNAKCCKDKHGTKVQRGNKTGKDLPLQSDAKFLCGRKMLQGLDGKPVNIPGNNKQADLDSSFQELQTESDLVKAENKGKTLKQKQDHKSKESRFPNGVDDESKAFLEAADEVANLMRKDYKGMDRPRRKPPINNNEPKN